MHRLHFILIACSVASPAWATGPFLEPNFGQFRPDVEFRAQTAGTAVDIDASGMIFRGPTGHLALNFKGGRPPRCAPIGTIEGHSNYLAVNPPISDVPEYSSVICREIYPGIDWVVRAATGTLEHDWRVAPGKNPGAIAMRIDAGSSAETMATGDLLLRSGSMKIVWKSPRAYQDVNGTRQPVESHYSVRGRTIRLTLAAYRHDLPLVIDPVIDFSYMVNGSGDDRASQVALDPAGNIYMAGLTLSPDFQTTPSAAFASPIQYPGSDYQLFVRKISPDGSKTIYSTYLGLGSLFSAHPIGLRVDASGNVYVAADAYGSPVSGTQAIDPNGTVALYKLGPAGDKLIYATRLFTTLSYIQPVALAIDNAGNAYVGAGSSTIYLSKIDPTGTHRVYGYQTTVGNYGGGLADVAVGPDGSAYLAGTEAVVGGTPGTAALTTTPGVLKPTVTNLQNYHGYLIRVKPDGSGPVFSTYIAGDDVDYVTALAVDAAGAAYVGGQTTSSSQFQGIQGAKLGLTHPPAAQAFVMKVTPDGTAAAYTALLPNSSVNALAVDGAGQAYSAGPITSPVATIFVDIGVAISKIDATGSTLLYYSALPLPAPTPNGALEPAYGIAVDSAGAAYLTGSIQSIQIPETAPSSRVLPNAFVLKIDAAPDQCDLTVQAQADASFLPNTPVHFLFTIQNNGPAAAQSVVLSMPQPQGGMLGGCAATGSGVCGTDPTLPRASFASIPPGGNVQVSLAINPNIGVASVALAATVSTLTSDVNQDNNYVSTTSPSSAVTINVGSNLNANYTITGSTAPINVPRAGISVPPYAVPGSQVQIFWPSPQVTPFGAAVFKNWADGSTDNPRTFTATPPTVNAFANFAPLFTPYVDSAAVVNAGSYAGGGVSPGEVISLFGVNLGQTTPGQVQNGQVTTSLNNVSVNFDGVPAPLLGISPTQINAVAPYEIAGQSSTSITVQSTNGSYNVTVPVVQAVPALVSANASGKGQAAALNPDNSINSPSNPAKPGDVVTLFGTGEGLVNPVPSDGTILPFPAPAPQLPITATIGGQPADVVYGAGAPGEVAGVIQINARIPTSGISYSHHVPVAWSAGSLSSQGGVTIAVADSPTPVPLFSVPASNITLPSIALSPNRIAADSDSTQITIYGTGFADGMVAQWNGQARATQFLDSTRLSVTLTGNDLETPQLGSLAVWDAGQTNQLTMAAPLLVYVPIVNRDLIYDSLRQLVYVSVAAAQKPQGASIAAMDPTTGRVTRWYPLTVEPTRLALSGDGRYLYIGLGNIIRRIDLNTWIADLDIPLGQDSLFGAREVYSMVTLSGSNTSLAVSFFKTGLSPPYLGTAVFDGAQMRPTVTGSHDGALYLIGSPDANTLYGADSSGNFYTLKVSPAGVTVAGTYPGLLGADGDSVFTGGLIYDGWGTAADPAVPSVVRLYDNEGLIAPSPSSQTVLILGGIPPSGYAVLHLPPVLTAYSGSSGNRLWSLALPVSLAINHGPMYQWGADGVVLREPQPNSSVAPGVDLFRIHASQ